MIIDNMFASIILYPLIKPFPFFGVIGLTISSTFLEDDVLFIISLFTNSLYTGVDSLFTGVDSLFTEVDSLFTKSMKLLVDEPPATSFSFIGIFTLFTLFT